MNKILILKEKYPKVNSSIFNSFVEGDETPTKKYLAYMLKVWTNKKGSSYTSNKLVQTVRKFEELLPYITDKDIYSPNYEKFDYLVNIVTKAEELKEEKTFVKTDHIKVIYEDDDILLVYPKTYKGSTKYGYGTKWCTASVSTDNYYKNYICKGNLGYLIDKKGQKERGYNKVAFYLEFGKELEGSFTIWSETDSQINSENLIKKGWDESTIIKIIMNFRLFSIEQTKYKIISLNVENTIKKIKSIDFENLFSNLKKLENYENESHYNDRVIVENFIEKIKSMTN